MIRRGEERRREQKVEQRKEEIKNFMEEKKTKELDVTGYGRIRERSDEQDVEQIMEEQRKNQR